MMKLMCYPICECGEVIKNLVSFTTFEKVAENYEREVRCFEPELCPNCKRKIESIQITTPSYGGRIVFKE